MEAKAGNPSSRPNLLLRAVRVVRQTFLAGVAFLLNFVFLLSLSVDIAQKYLSFLVVLPNILFVFFKSAAWRRGIVYWNLPVLIVALLFIINYTPKASPWEPKLENGMLLAWACGFMLLAHRDLLSTRFKKITIGALVLCLCAALVKAYSILNP